MPTNFLQDSVAEVGLIIQRYMVIATTTSNAFAQQLVQDTIMVACWSLQKSSYIVLPSPLSLDILEWLP